MRKRYIQVNGELVDAAQYVPPSVAAPFVMDDIAPYKSMQTGEIITSRSRHREHLRAHRLVEIGDQVHHMKPYGPRPAPGLKETLIEVARDKLRG